MLAHLGVRWEDSHLHAVAHVSPDVADNGALVILEVAPKDSLVSAVRGLVEKLFGELRFGVGSFGYEQQSRRILVDAVNETECRVVDIEFRVVLQVPCYGIE